MRNLSDDVRLFNDSFLIKDTGNYTYRNDGARSSRPAPIYGLSGTISQPPAHGSTAEETRQISNRTIDRAAIVDAVYPSRIVESRCNEIYPDAIRGTRTRNRGFRFASHTEGSSVKDGNGISIRFA